MGLFFSTMGGIFPMLLLVSSWRAGRDVPYAVNSILGHSSLTAGVYLLYLVSLSIGVMILSMTIVQMRRGILTPRAVVT